jgi:ribosomal 30S subunit maturation factor RimM
MDDVLIPFTEAICRRIDPAGRVIEIDPPEGLIELNRPAGPR